MRFPIRTERVENSLYIKYYKVNINALSTSVVENSFYIKYYKVNIKALSIKEFVSGEHIVY
jgi:hypothetical protein